MAPKCPLSGWPRWRAGILATLLLHGGVLLALIVRIDSAPPHSAPPSFAVEMVAAPPSPSPQPDTPQEQPQPQTPPQPVVTPLPPLDLPRTQTSGIAVPPPAPQPARVATADRPPAPPAPPPAAAVAVAAAPRAATTGTDPNAKMTWEADVLARLEAGKRYPASARFAREEATIMVEFVVDRKGRVVRSRLVRPSNIADLDAEVLSLLRRVRLPAPPTATPDDSLELTVPIEFSIDRG